MRSNGSSHGCQPVHNILGSSLAFGSSWSIDSYELWLIDNEFACPFIPPPFRFFSLYSKISPFGLICMITSKISVHLYSRTRATLLCPFPFFSFFSSEQLAIISTYVGVFLTARAGQTMPPAEGKMHELTAGWFRSLQVPVKSLFRMISCRFFPSLKQTYHSRKLLLYKRYVGWWNSLLCGPHLLMLI